MLVVNRFQVNDPGPFRDEATAALKALSACQGFVRGHCGAGVDEPESWVMVTEWESVGAYRRALSGFDVKMHAMPLLSRGLAEPSAFEVLVDAGPGEVQEHSSDRADPRSGAPSRGAETP